MTKNNGSGSGSGSGMKRKTGSGSGSGSGIKNSGSGLKYWVPVMVPGTKKGQTPGARVQLGGDRVWKIYFEGKYF